MGFPRINTLLFCALSFCAAAAWPAHAQTTPVWDTSGNGFLKGTYYYRQVIYSLADNYGDLGEAASLFGNITFDGNGHYALTGTIMDSGTSGPENLSSTPIAGTYSIAASGLGSISNPLLSGQTIYGLVSNGIFIGSSTESGYNDLFIAAPLGSPQATNSNFQGKYWVAQIDFPDGDVTTVRDSLWQLNPDGQGNLGAVSLSGYIGGLGSQTVNQTVAAGHYSFSNGAAQVTFGGTLTNSNLIAGGKLLYISPDGNFIFGGSANGWDMFVGVRAAASAANGLSGLYYQAGIDQDESTLSSGYGSLDTYYGSFNANAGTGIAHHRILSQLSIYGQSAFDYTYNDAYTPNGDGSYSGLTGAVRYMIGAGGQAIGFGVDPYLGISVALPAPFLSGSGVYLNPEGVVNAASSAPFTAGLSRGEMVTLYGTNLASTTELASTIPLPQTLGGVQVNINNRPAPISFVSPGQLSVLVPYATELTLAQIQVINNNVASNTVTVYMNYTMPGVFTNPEGGLGYAAALHGDYTPVTSASPAQIGETIQVFVTGLGDVSPANADGDAGPATSPYSVATNAISAAIDGIPATVSYAGLAPALAGLYQVNVTVPSGVASGNVYLDIAGPDAYTSEALLPTGTPAASASAPAALRRAHPAASRSRLR